MTVQSSLAELLSASGDAAYDWNLHIDHIDWYGSWTKLFGENGKPPENSDAFYNAITPDDRHLVFGVEGQSFDRQYRLRAPDGTLIWVHERGNATLENGRVIGQRGILRIIDKSAATALFTEMHDRDSLTGCISRLAMLAQLTRAMEASKATRRASSYMVLGIDKMSFVNEAVGMEAGDALLRGVGDRLRQIIPNRATLARVGGDMFGILLPEPMGGDLRVLAERLLQNFRDNPVVTSVTPLHITVSIGGVSLPTVAKSATEAMIFAEQAVHDAHQRGRNLFVEYMDSPERTQGNRELLELGERIKHAFKNDGFRLAYQPIIETSTGKVVCYEALVRMFDSDGKPVAAAAFVPAIEQLGLAYELDSRVLEMALKELEAAPNLTLAINVSGLTAIHADWPDYVRARLQESRQIAERLIVEITETAPIVDVSETRRFIDTLVELGARASLDDFGAGSTSIRHLRSLDLSIMKIDKELLNKVTEHKEQQHLVKMLIELARGLGLQTIAEGVEDEATAAWLRDEAKVDMMQGYYFGRPALEKPWAAAADVAPGTKAAANSDGKATHSKAG
jgi:diguanylate cyclase (GGDEF)-like protein